MSTEIPTDENGTPVYVPESQLKKKRGSSIVKSISSKVNRLSISSNHSDNTRKEHDESADSRDSKAGRDSVSSTVEEGDGVDGDSTASRRKRSSFLHKVSSTYKAQAEKKAVKAKAKQEMRLAAQMDAQSANNDGLGKDYVEEEHFVNPLFDPKYLEDGLDVTESEAPSDRGHKNSNVGGAHANGSQGGALHSQSSAGGGGEISDGVEVVDTIIHARWVIPGVPEGEVLENYSVAIHEGSIYGICPQDEARSLYKSDQTYFLGEHAIIPGLINGHSHAGTSLFRGLTSDERISEWVEANTSTLENEFVNDEFVRDATLLAAAEMINSGITCFNDSYHHTQVTAETALQTGLRLGAGLTMNQIGEIANSIPQFKSQMHKFETVHPIMAPMSINSLTEGQLEGISALTHDLRIPFHVSLHETVSEVEESVKKYQLRPIERLRRVGLVNSYLIATHMTQLTDQEVELLSQSGASVVHCPKSNMKMAAGFCPVHRLQRKGINVALGSDGLIANDRCDILAEMQTASLLGKIVGSNKSTMSAGACLSMATINAAKAMHIDHIVGSLETGKKADLIAVDLFNSDLLPIYSPLVTLVYSARSEHVSYSWVNGKCVMKNRKLQTIDQTTVEFRARNWGEKVHAFVSRSLPPSPASAQAAAIAGANIQADGKGGGWWPTQPKLWPN
eukprot:GFYU01024513.1.p1 GENE.GFYU01024513.1~~GFYU01024513.1.p1  ORF type:complete len:677 (-),score=124.59 GFYU01024513.1:34-2064(-)